MELSQQQLAAASVLKRALALATESGLFDELAAYVDPDHINRTCDAVAELLADVGADQLVVPDRVDIEHWDSPAYGGDAEEHKGMTFPFEIIDMREGSGQLLVNIGDDNGEIDDLLSAAFEITTPPGSKAPAASLMVYGGEEVIVKLFRQPNGYLLEAQKPGVRIVDTMLSNGAKAWMLLDR